LIFELSVPCADTNSTTVLATEARVNPALPATAVVKMARWHGTYYHPLLKTEIVAENPLFYIGFSDLIQPDAYLGIGTKNDIINLIRG